MKIVYALKDIEAIGERSKWKPRKVWCTADSVHAAAFGASHLDTEDLGAPHVVKFRQGREGTAALISEVVCGELFAAGGIPLASRRLVMVTDQFTSKAPYPIVPGYHFGTELVAPTQGGPPESLRDIANPHELVDLWVFDTWVWNIDRTVFGNMLLVASATDDDKFDILAIDHSDCFGGAKLFSSGAWKPKMLAQGPASSVKYILEAVVAVNGLDASLRKVDVARRFIGHAISSVPKQWWDEAMIKRDDVAEVLETRAARLAHILNARQWDHTEIAEATRGGLILNINGDNSCGGGDNVH